jgi:hypothetical protein
MKGVYLQVLSGFVLGILKEERRVGLASFPDKNLGSEQQ